MVAETEIQTSGWWLADVGRDGALADGGRAGEHRQAGATAGSARLTSRGRELALERGDLLGAEPAHPAALGDAEPLHDLAGADLAEAGHRLQQVDDPHLADHLVVLALVEHVDDRGAGVLEPVLDLGPLAARGGGLLEGRLALFGGERGQSHGAVLRARESAGSGRSI